MNRLLQSHPDLQDTISVVRQVGVKAKYPIASFDDLANTLGGENAAVTFRGRTLTMAEARSIIPAYYFPIASEADLTAKMADLAKALPTLSAVASAPTLESVIRLMPASAAAPTFAVPTINVEEVLSLAGGRQKPGTGGVVKSQ
ncbi:MAG: hypothetical protein ABI165_07355 [Bryobacteraceae bacterium]